MAVSVDASSRTPASISAVIPALNEEEAIGETVRALQRAGVHEIIVVDGGSADRTVDRAVQTGARVVSGDRGRGRQLAEGAARSTGEILWFVHADTLAPADGCERIIEALRRPRCVGGHFGIRFSGRSLPARFLTWLYRHLRLIGLRYGDSAFFVDRIVYERVGGFRPLPIFEDLDLLRRLRREGRFVRAPSTVVTSSRRFEDRSFILVFARWMVMQLLYWIGMSPERLGKSYAPVRAAGPQGDRAAK